MPAYPMDGGGGDGSGLTYDDSGNVVDLNTGYIADDSGGGGPTGIPDTTGAGGTSTAQWGTLFSNIAISAASIFKSVSGTGQVINPQTGLPYSQAQLSQLRAQQTSQASLSKYLPWILIGAVAYFLLRRKL